MTQDYIEGSDKILRTERIFMKKNGLFAKGMALFLALLMIASVVFAVVAYVQQ